MLQETQGHMNFFFSLFLWKIKKGQNNIKQDGAKTLIDCISGSRKDLFLLKYSTLKSPDSASRQKLE